MKILGKFFLPLTVITLLAISFGTNAQKLSKSDIMPGYYTTSDDFIKGNLTKKEVYIGTSKWYFVENMKKGDATPWKDGKMWGYVDNQNFTWRLYVDEYNCFRIITNGKIWVYTNGFVDISADKDGNYTQVVFSDAARGSFSERIRISDGPNGKLLRCDKDNLLKLLADDKDVCAKINDKGIFEHKESKWGESLGDVLGWVKEYNDKHK